MMKVNWVRTLMVGLSVVLFSSVALAGDFGTKAEAKAMLQKVIDAVKADKAKALANFKAGKAGFKDRDLYPYCGGPDGNFTAHPRLTGKPLKGLKDKTGHDFGTEIYKVAKEGKVSEVEYMWPRPAGKEPVKKIALVTKVDDQICVVGYYM